MKLLKSKSLLTYCLSIGASAIGIILNFILARFLGAVRYGNIQYLIGLATTISSFLVIGLNTFIIREASNKRFGKRLMSKCFSLYSSVLVFSVPILLFILKNIGIGDQMDLQTWLVIIVSFLIGADLLIASFFQGIHKYYLSIIFETLIPKCALLIISLVFISLNIPDELVQYYLLFYIAVYSLIFIPLFIKTFKGFDFKISRDDLSSILFFFGVTITYSLGTNLTKVLQVALYNNAVALAIISVSISIISLARVFTSVIDSIIQPKFAQCKRENDTESIIKLYRLDIRINSYFAIPLYLFFAICSSKFLSIFGDSYLEYPMILSIIAIAYGFTCVFGPNGTMLSMIGKEKTEFLNGFIYFAAYLISVFIFSFSPTYGLSIALLVAILVVNIVKYIEIWLIFKKSPIDLKTLITVVLIIATNFVPIYFANKISDFTIWLISGIGIGLGLVIINAFVLSLYRVKDIKNLIALK